ncbi:MAG: nuclear transport factor 2 family protein [Verrucomicrobia bacterium]|nr:nuclear transport factor 2 family protein [Leptolyngbya sp. ES-bin-22]
MPKPLHNLPATPQLPSRRQTRGRWQAVLVAIGLTLTPSGVALHAQRVNAEPPETAPTQLKETLAAIDKAATSHNIQAVLAFYNPNFTHSDGLTRQTLEQALTQLWKRYPNLTYRTDLKTWKAEGSGFMTETVTHVTGVQKVGDRELKIDSTLQSQQQFENQKIVRQEILAERSQITSGTNPPNVKLNLPEQVNAGQEFSFDAVVQEPLGNDLLLGTALEEPVKAGGFVSPTTVNLELLSAGGIFKVGRAPLTADNRWISAVLVRHDGMTMITQRLRIVSRAKAAQ